MDEVVSQSELSAGLEKSLGRKPSTAEVIASFLKARGGSHPLAPADFPLGLARELEERGFALRGARTAAVRWGSEAASQCSTLACGRTLSCVEGPARVDALICGEDVVCASRTPDATRPGLMRGTVLAAARNR